MAKDKSHLPIDTYTISAIRFEDFIEYQILTAREHTDEIIHILKNLPSFARFLESTQLFLVEKP